MIRSLLTSLKFHMMRLDRNEASYVAPDRLGTAIPPFRPTYRFGGEFIDEHHRSYSTCKLVDDKLIDIGIPGWLRREDALKLYELAYHATGDILELGTHQGLSTAILSDANAQSPVKKEIHAVDLNCEFVQLAKTRLSGRGLDHMVQFHCGDAVSFCMEQIARKKRFSFIFVDHSHEYGPVLEVCKLLDKLLQGRGFCLFHDFNDPRNNDPDNKDVAVAQAVYDGLSPDRFEFYGIFGCTALYRARS